MGSRLYLHSGEKQGPFGMQTPDFGFLQGLLNTPRPFGAGGGLSGPAQLPNQLQLSPTTTSLPPSNYLGGLQGWTPTLTQGQQARAAQTPLPPTRVTMQDLVDSFWDSPRTMVDVDNLQEQIRALFEEQGVPPFKAIQDAAMQVQPFRQSVSAATRAPAEEEIQSQIAAATPAATTPEQLLQGQIAGQRAIPAPPAATLAQEEDAESPVAATPPAEAAVGRTTEDIANDARHKIRLGESLTPEDIAALNTFNEFPTAAQISGASQIGVAPTTDGGEVSYEFPSGFETTYGMSTEAGLPPAADAILQGQIAGQQGIPDTSGQDLWRQELPTGTIFEQDPLDAAVAADAYTQLLESDATGRRQLFNEALRSHMGGGMLSAPIIAAADRRFAPLQTMWDLQKSLGGNQRFSELLAGATPSRSPQLLGDMGTRFQLGEGGTPYGRSSFLPGMFEQLLPALLMDTASEAYQALPWQTHKWRRDLEGNPAAQIALAQQVYSPQMAPSMQAGLDQWITEDYYRRMKQDPSTPFLAQLAQQGGYRF